MLAAVFAVVFAAQGQDSGRGRKYKPPPPTCKITVTVLKSSNGKPLENASVVFHPLENGKDKGNMELKTNEDGKTVIDVLPTGSKVTLQVIAKGFQTYGRDYTIDKSQMSIEVKMKRPGQQYSIYEDHSQEANSGQNPDADKDSSAAKSADAGKDTNKDASKDHPAESAKESDSKPDTTQPQPQKN